MRRVLFHFFGRPIHSYPAMLYVGLVFGTIAGNFAAHVAGLDAFRVFVASYILFFPAIGGARVLHVVSNWKFYREHRALIWNLNQGGMAQYGGILLAVPLSIPLLAALDLPFGKFWDIGSFTILTGMIFTRFGCFLNGCCSGRPSNAWGSMYLPNRLGVWEQRVPTQLMEAGWAITLLISAFAIWPHLPFDGALFVFVAGGYALGRLALESMRDLRTTGKRFTINHAISLFIVAISVAALTARTFM